MMFRPPAEVDSAQHTALIYAYIGSHRADTLLPQHDLDSGIVAKLYAAGMLISNSCVMLSEGYNSEADTHLELVASAIRDIKKDLRPGDSRFATMRTLGHITTMLQYRGDKDVFDEERQALQRVNVAELHRRREIIKNYDEKMSLAQARHRTIGHVAGIGQPALLERSGYPWLLALPALPHEDNRVNVGNTARSFDSVLLEANLATGYRRNYRLQTKNRCLNYCKQNVVPANQQQKVRARYQRNIYLTSGHCDLDITSTEAGYDAPLIDALIREGKGKATPEDKTYLDEATSTLLRDLADNSQRRGIWHAGQSVRAR